MNQQSSYPRDYGKLKGMAWFDQDHELANLLYAELTRMSIHDGFALFSREQRGAIWMEACNGDTSIVTKTIPKVSSEGFRSDRAEGLRFMVQKSDSGRLLIKSAPNGQFFVRFDEVAEDLMVYQPSLMDHPIPLKDHLFSELVEYGNKLSERMQREQDLLARREAERQRRLRPDPQVELEQALAYLIANEGTGIY